MNGECEALSQAAGVGVAIPAAASATFEIDALCGLPQPLHLFAGLTQSLHFHLGLGGGRATTLRHSMARVSRRAAARLPPGTRVLDVGCGLGGTVGVLARRGHAVVGIDPCPARLAVARRAFGALSGVTLLQTSLQELGRPTREFGAVLMIEVLQHLPDLDVAFGDLAERVVAGGVVVVCDVALVPVVPWERVPFHRLGRLPEVAQRRGFRVQARVDLSAATRSSLVRLHAELARRRSALAAAFASRPGIAAEIDELDAQLEHLQAGFDAGYLRFESTVLVRL